jgi:N-acetylmuramoyl-L-alanine amidase
MTSRSWWQNKPWPGALAAGAVVAGMLVGCRTAPVSVTLSGDEIIVAGRRFHTGTRVITWLEPRGYNAYLSPPLAGKSPGLVNGAATAGSQNHGVRRGLETKERPGAKPDLAALQAVVDQFILHYDGCGLSQVCFDILQRRGLSSHFLLDVDGTIYQTLDLRECAQHATTANNRSVGIEIANIGAHPPGESKPLDEWYRRDKTGKPVLMVPPLIHAPRVHTPDFTGRPARPAKVGGMVQGRELEQYDFTPEQYAALTKLTAALCRVLPRIRCDYPRDGAGRLIRRKLSDEELARYRGILGHFHIQENKVDPGPALQWDVLIDGARRWLK